MHDPVPTILLVDDEPINLEILSEFLDGSSYRIETAADGQAAWEALQADPERYDAVLLDRMMPGLSGTEVLALIKGHPVLQSVPVILQTALAAREEVLDGLRAGAYYYLTKPFDQEMLLSVLATAVADRQRYRQVQQDSDLAGRTFGLMSEATFSFRDLDAARDLAMVLANACPDPRRAAIGLSELLINAVEHGNLGISYAEKGLLREQDRWHREIETRLADPAYAGRQVHVHYLRERDCIRVRIRDEGAGFAWQDYIEMDPGRAFDTHGRGIAMSRMVSFDSLEYLGNGNEVEVTVLTTSG
jgi:CheY-like chemotaxis protein/anti-sigma regulatory factor (Ser/Thr protein kinase)